MKIIPDCPDLDGEHCKAEKCPVEMISYEYKGRTEERPFGVTYVDTETGTMFLVATPHFVVILGEIQAEGFKDITVAKTAFDKINEILGWD
jgi:hypothetical protein